RRVAAVASMRWKLALTYKLRQDPADPLDVVVRQPRVEGQGERPGEAGIRVLERALVAVGAQAMEGVRPDLRLDSFAAERDEGVGISNPARVAIPWWRRRRTDASSSSLEVVTAPPSPVVTTFRGWNDRQPITPNPPHAIPRQRAPSAPAASSISTTSGGTALC